MGWRLEIVLRDELDLSRGAGCVAEDLTEGTAGQDQIRIGNSERWRVRNVLRFDTKFQILRFGKVELLTQRHVEVEERWSIEKVSADIARLTRRRYEELRALLSREENVLTVFQCHTAEVR